MITIVDYNTGNIGSIQNILKRIGEDSVVTSDENIIDKAEKLILPGVGAFDTGMKNLHKLSLIDILNKKVLNDGIPILGICLGMQLMANNSEEGSLKGLGWIESEVRRFTFIDSNNFKIPHMGWNFINIKKQSPLFADLPADSRFYFVHSYYIDPFSNSNILASTYYEQKFTSVVEKNNILGVQFHPEKSHKFGMILLNNFVKNY